LRQSFLIALIITPIPPTLEINSFNLDSSKPRSEGVAVCHVSPGNTICPGVKVGVGVEVLVGVGVGVGVPFYTV